MLEIFGKLNKTHRLISNLVRLILRQLIIATMRMTKSLLILLLILCSSLGFSQELDYVNLGVIEGEFKEFRGEVYFFNNTKQEVKVSLNSLNERLSASISSASVKPQDTLEITYKIDLRDAPGLQEFELQLVNEDEMIVHGYQFVTQVLVPEQDVFKAYRNVIWPFRTKEKVFNLKAAYKGDTLNSSFEVYNLGGVDLDLSQLNTDGKYWFDFQPKHLDHNRFARMTIYRITNPEEESGFFRETASIVLNRDTLANLPIQFTLIPKPISGGELVSGGPRITSSILDHDFKDVKEGSVEEVQINLANVGNDRLNIQKLESNCDCLSFDLNNYKIQPGKSASLNVKLDTNNRIGLERKSIAIFSNDRQKPTLVLTFKAHIK